MKNQILKFDHFKRNLNVINNAKKSFRIEIFDDLKQARKKHIDYKNFRYKMIVCYLEKSGSNKF